MAHILGRAQLRRQQLRLPAAAPAETCTKRICGRLLGRQSCITRCCKKRCDTKVLDLRGRLSYLHFKACQGGPASLPSWALQAALGHPPRAESEMHSMDG